MDYMLRIKMKMTNSLFLIGLFLIAGQAQAAIYKHIDSTGRVTYSNKPLKGAIQITTYLEDKQQAKHAVNNEKKKGSSTVGPIHRQLKAPTMADTIMNTASSKIDAATQKSRDIQREYILTSELSREIAMQKEGEERLVIERMAPNPNATHIKQLEDDLQVHTKNIMALKREIKYMK